MSVDPEFERLECETCDQSGELRVCGGDYDPWRDGPYEHEEVYECPVCMGSGKLVRWMLDSSIWNGEFPNEEEAIEYVLLQLERERGGYYG